MIIHTTMTTNGSDCGDAGVVDVAVELGLDDAEDEAAGEGEREERKPATSAAAIAASTRLVIVADLELDDRGDQDAGHAGERRAERPVGRGDPVRRQAHASPRPAGSRPPRWSPCRTGCSGRSAQSADAHDGGDARQDEAVDRDVACRTMWTRSRGSSDVTAVTRAP